MSETEPIRVWRFRDAPEGYRELSKHGGDEDWLAVIPATMEDVWIPWMMDGGQFGVAEVSRHLLADGRIVAIGAHS